MKQIILSMIIAALTVGCVTTTISEELERAKQCVKEYADENGVIVEAPPEHRNDCWKEVNKRIESKERADTRREAANPQFKCPPGSTLYCIGRIRRSYENCNCISNQVIRDAINRANRF